MIAVLVQTVIDLFESDYYLAVPLGQIVYISEMPMLEEMAIFILSSGQRIQNENKSGTLSTYTFMEGKAEMIARYADADHRGVDRSQGEALWHRAETGKMNSTVYHHYHPGTEETKLAPHSFYGDPIFTALLS
jgi:outer membrane protein W